MIFARKGREAPETLNPGAVKAEVAAAGGAATGDEDARDNGTGTGGATGGQTESKKNDETPDPDESDSAGKVENGTPGTSKGE